MDSILAVSDLTYTYPGESRWALNAVSFRVTSGECVCFSGPSGCGKSTLLLALKGLLPGKISDDCIRYSERSPTSKEKNASIGMVFQNAESQLLCSTVFDEVAFGPENLCVPPAEINQRIIEALSTVDLLEFGNRNVERFSAGQKQRLCIASILSMHPQLILLDEPTSQLDNKGKKDLLELLRKLKEKGISIIIAEHNIEPFAEIIDRYFLMKNGRITETRKRISEKHRFGTKTIKPFLRNAPPPSTEREASAESLSFSYPDGETMLKNITLEIKSGELVHLYGENGCGKSTFLKILAGVVPPDSGDLTVSGKNFPKIGSLLGKLAFLSQNPQRQLFEDTVYDEVAFTLKRLNLTEMETKRRVEYALSLCEAFHLKNRLPLTLSFGEQHRVALASVIAPQPTLLLLDEPFAGLDSAQRIRLLNILSRLRTENRISIVIASHDLLPDPAWADRVISMHKGEILPPEALRQ